MTLRKKVNEKLTKIAKKHMANVTTLETRKSDNLDFPECAVWEIKAALKAAFKAGVKVGATINEATK